MEHAINLTHDGTLILRIPKGYEVDKVVVEEMGTDNRKKFVHMPTNISNYCDELWKKAYERGKAEGQPRRGKWHGKGDSEGFGIFICDNCEKFAMMEYDFCPNCGADMRGEQK